MIFRWLLASVLAAQVSLEAHASGWFGMSGGLEADPVYRSEFTTTNAAEVKAMAEQVPGIAGAVSNLQAGVTSLSNSAVRGVEFTDGGTSETNEAGVVRLTGTDHFVRLLLTTSNALYRVDTNVTMNVVTQEFLCTQHIASDAPFLSGLIQQLPGNRWWTPGVWVEGVGWQAGVSEDGFVWTPIADQVGTPRERVGVFQGNLWSYGDTQGGETKFVKYSTDTGTNWLTATEDGPDTWLAQELLEFRGRLWTLPYGGSPAGISVSPDGVQWELLPFPEPIGLIYDTRMIVFNDTLYYYKLGEVAPETAGWLYTTTDGTNWSAGLSGNMSGWPAGTAVGGSLAFVHANAIWLVRPTAVDTNYIAYSSDGVNWNNITLPESFNERRIWAVTPTISNNVALFVTGPDNVREMWLTQPGGVFTNYTTNYTVTLTGYQASAVSAQAPTNGVFYWGDTALASTGGTLHAETLLPLSSEATIGTAERPFAHGYFSEGSITLGKEVISAAVLRQLRQSTASTEQTLDQYILDHVNTRDSYAYGLAEIYVNTALSQDEFDLAASTNYLFSSTGVVNQGAMVLQSKAISASIPPRYMSLRLWTTPTPIAKYSTPRVFISPDGEDWDEISLALETVMSSYQTYHGAAALPKITYADTNYIYRVETKATDQLQIYGVSLGYTYGGGQ